MIKKISIKDVMCDIKTINNKMYISDADTNRVLYPKTKTISRGKVISKDKLCNTDRNQMIKVNGIMFYPVNTALFDDCVHNQNVLR